MLQAGAENVKILFQTLSSMHRFWRNEYRSISNEEVSSTKFDFGIFVAFMLSLLFYNYNTVFLYPDIWRF